MPCLIMSCHIMPYHVLPQNASSAGYDHHTIIKGKRSVDERMRIRENWNPETAAAGGLVRLQQSVLLEIIIHEAGRTFVQRRR